MEKVTKKELARKIKALEGFVDYADNMLTQLNHALPEPLDIKHWRDEQADRDELMEILDNKEPKPKQLDQSVFDGLDAKWRFAAVDNDGRAYGFMKKPVIDQDDPCFIDEYATRCKWIGEGYDTSDWQNSLIERKELTGSDLCRAMLARGDKFVVCAVDDESESNAVEMQEYRLITNVGAKYEYDTGDYCYRYAVPVNNQGEPLTATDVGL